MTLVSLKLDPKESKNEALGSVDYDKPAYPYGTCLCLDNAALEKLGITDLPDVGTEIYITAIAKVSSVSSYDSENSEGERRSLDLQITDIALEGIEDNDDESSPGDKLYGK